MKNINNFIKKKSFGQNFLISQKHTIEISKIIGNNNSLLEVGAGSGLLTDKIIKNQKKLLLVEFDKELFEFLKIKYADAKNLKIENIDILDFDTDLMKQKYVVCGNIPYGISSPLIKKFITTKNPPDRIIFLLQKEYVKKIASDKKGSFLNLFIQIYAKTKKHQIITKKNFDPVPKVDSQLLEIIPHKKQKIEKKNVKNFVSFLKICFSSQRKTLWNNLKCFEKDEIKKEKCFEKFDLDKKIRAEKISLETFFNIFYFFTH